MKKHRKYFQPFLIVIRNKKNLILEYQKRCLNGNTSTGFHALIAVLQNQNKKNVFTFQKKILYKYL